MIGKNKFFKTLSLDFTQVLQSFSDNLQHDCYALIFFLVLELIHGQVIRHLSFLSKCI
uniref:Uncharacterized protein n=1 Tax=Rhizophora mucronata TaxID=61149 RepID=A0A2P2PA03_RHIMU